MFDSSKVERGIKKTMFRHYVQKHILTLGGKDIKYFRSHFFFQKHNTSVGWERCIQCYLKEKWDLKRKAPVWMSQTSLFLNYAVLVKKKKATILSVTLGYQSSDIYHKLILKKIPNTNSHFIINRIVQGTSFPHLPISKSWDDNWTSRSCREIDL